MATSFVYSMISGATYKSTTDRAKSLTVLLIFRCGRFTLKQEVGPARRAAASNVQFADDPFRTSLHSKMLFSRRERGAGGTRASAPAGMCSRLGTWSVRLRLCSSP